jgi:hypothetical protein
VKNDVDFSQFMATVARALLGEPTSKRGHKWLYGRNGSLVVDVQKGVWHDFENNCGGGVLDLIEVKKGTDKAGALDYLVELKCLSVTKPNGYAANDTVAETKAAAIPYDAVNDPFSGRRRVAIISKW